MLAGVSVDYYVRMERGGLAGASDSVLDALATALQLDDAEREHLFDLARAASAGSARRARKPSVTVRPAIQQVLEAINDAPAWVRNGRHDILAMNPLARALYEPVFASDPRRPANTTRFVYLHPDQVRELFVDYDQIATDDAAMLRLEAGRNPHDKALIELVGELSTRSELFRQRWATQDVRYHRSGRKRLRHPAVGQLDLDFEAMELPSEPGRHRDLARRLKPADYAAECRGWPTTQMRQAEDIIRTAVTDATTAFPGVSQSQLSRLFEGSAPQSPWECDPPTLRTFARGPSVLKRLARETTVRQHARSVVAPACPGGPGRCVRRPR